VHQGVGEALTISRLRATLTTELPVTAQRGRKDLFSRRGLCADFVTDRVGRAHDVIGQSPQSFDLHRHDIAWFDWSRNRGRADKMTSPGTNVISRATSVMR